MFSHNSEVETLTAGIVAFSKSIEERYNLLTLLTENSTLIASHGNTLLANLNYSEHSFACLHILWTLKGTPQPGENRRRDADWMKKAIRFLKECDPTWLDIIRAKLLSVARSVKKEAMSSGHPHLAVLPLRHAVQKHAPSADHLTPLHADFFQICLLARNYAAAKDVLFTDVYEMDPTTTSLSPTDFQLYCYYGGRLAIGLKSHARALELFHLALVAPTLASNAITLMIYKLYVLVSLLDNGEVPDLPRYTSSAVLRLIRAPSMTPYVRLIDAYHGMGKGSVEKVMRDCKQSFEEDNSYGLVKQVAESLVQRDIKRLTRSYITRSLADLAQECGLESEHAVEQLILQFVKDGRLAAEVSSEKGMVTFLDETETFDSSETTDQLDSMIQQVMALGERMQSVKDVIELDPEYRAKVLQTKQHSKLDG